MGAGGAGTQTSGLIFGGYDNTAVNANTETYDGTTFSEVNDLNTARYLMGSNGTQTSALSSGGYITSAQSITESWNGSSWTEVNDLNTARNGSAAG